MHKEGKAESVLAEDPISDLGDLLVAYLDQLDIDYVFGIPGGAIEPLYNALARSERRGGVRSIVARHETGSAFMADGYTKYSGKLGVCCSTTGPGATNLITGVSSAYENHIPMLVITAQTPLSTFGRGAFQESSCTGINTVALLDNCTKYSSLVSHPDQFEHKLSVAILTAFQDPMGPVHLSVPMDVMKQACELEAPNYYLPELIRKPSMLDDEALRSLYKELESAKNPVFLIGDGASESIGTLLSLAMLLNARVLVTPHGKGLVSPYHPLFRGVVGFAGHHSANSVLAESDVDLVVAVGTSLGEWASNGWDSNAVLTRKLVHVEETASNLTRTPMARLHVKGRLLTIFEKILTRFEMKKSASVSAQDLKSPEPSSCESGVLHFSMRDEAAFVSDEAPIKPQRLMNELPKLFPPNTRYLADTGASFAWATHYLHPYDRRFAGKREASGGVFRASMEFSSMGWAIGCAVGTALARRGDPVVCITGDGSVLMGGQEITVAVQEKLPLFLVILNDSSLGMVKHGQAMTGAEPIGTELPFVDFAKFAESMGIRGYTIKTPDDLLSIDVDSLIKQNEPVVFDVRIDPDEKPPIGLRTGSIRDA
ncbi:MAG: thiamine pyrophosphate-binding protein [bacterium]